MCVMEQRRDDELESGQRYPGGEVVSKIILADLMRWIGWHHTKERR